MPKRGEIKEPLPFSRHAIMPQITAENNPRIKLPRKPLKSPFEFIALILSKNNKVILHIFNNIILIKYHNFNKKNKISQKIFLIVIDYKNK